MKRATLLFALMAFVACNGSPPRTPSPTPGPTSTTGALPAPAERTRDEVVRAARTLDYEALDALTGKDFRYSFGEESGDPVGYWRKLESEGHVPIFGDIMPLVFDTHHARQGDIYVWPAAFAKVPDDWSAEDIADLRTLMNEEDIEQQRRAGGYLGWRAGIQKDGTWVFFIAGD